MERKYISDPMQFFKVMMPGFHHKLSLPPIVSKEVEKLKSRRMFLESRIGRWRVSLCRNKENGLICLEQGWPQFVERHALKVGEFVFFKHTGDLRFNVSIYKTNFCENMFLEEEKEDDEEEEDEEEGNQTLIPHKQSTIEEETVGDESLFFEKTIVANHATKSAKVYIPLGFMRLNNLGVHHSRVILVDPIGREWDITLSGYSSDRLRYRMQNRGWHDFYASNALNIGDICVFRLNRRLLTSITIVFNVKIVRAK